MTEFLLKTFAAYSLTFIIASSSLFEPIRTFFKLKAPKLQIGAHKHFIECRMCVGFWAALFICIIYNQYTDLFAIYGLSYFLATQER